MGLVVAVVAVLTVLAGCGSDGETTTVTTSPEGSATGASGATGHTADASDCRTEGATERADEIAANLRGAGYKGVKVVSAPAERIKGSPPFTRVLVEVPELNQRSEASVDVFCTQTDAESESAAVGGSGFVYEIRGSAAYGILGFNDYNPVTGKKERLPPLQPLLDKLVEAGEGA